MKKESHRERSRSNDKYRSKESRSRRQELTKVETILVLSAEYTEYLLENSHIMDKIVEKIDCQFLIRGEVFPVKRRKTIRSD